MPTLDTTPTRGPRLALRTLAPARPAPPTTVPNGDVPRPFEPFDADWARRIERDILAPLSHTWFRTRLVGGERIPTAGPAILAANHSGNAFPYDGIVLDALLWRRDGMEPARKIRSVYEPELSLRWWMRPFGIHDFWRRAGGVDMTFDNFERLIARGDRVLYFPEGVPGIGKGFAHRYQLQPFKSSFALLSARHGVPVVPIHIVNAEWIHPLGFSFKWLDRLFDKLFRVPFLPLPAAALGIVLPWFWWITFPVQLTFVVGEPLDVSGAMRAEGITDFDNPDRAALRRAVARLRATMQAQLSDAVDRYGQRPFDLPSLRRHFAEAGRGRWKLLPWAWPVTWLTHERDGYRPPARSRLHAIVRDLDLAAFYVPFGWPLLTLARRLRRPPYGLRGVPRAERRAMCGEYLWRLAERPLPAKE